MLAAWNFNWGTSGWHISKSKRHHFLLSTAQGTIMHKNLSDIYSSTGQWYTSHAIPRCLDMKGLSKWIWDDYCESVYIEKSIAQQWLHSTFCIPTVYQAKIFSSYIIHNLLQGFHKASTYPLHKGRGKRRNSEKKRFWKYVCWMSSQCQGHTRSLARSKINKQTVASPLLHPSRYDTKHYLWYYRVSSRCRAREQPLKGFLHLPFPSTSSRSIHAIWYTNGKKNGENKR